MTCQQASSGVGPPATAMTLPPALRDRRRQVGGIFAATAASSSVPSWSATRPSARAPRHSSARQHRAPAAQVWQRRPSRRNSPLPATALRAVCRHACSRSRWRACTARCSAHNDLSIGTNPPTHRAAAAKAPLGRAGRCRIRHGRPHRASTSRSCRPGVEKPWATTRRQRRPRPLPTSRRAWPPSVRKIDVTNAGPRNWEPCMRVKPQSGTHLHGPAAQLSSPCP